MSPYGSVLAYTHILSAAGPSRTKRTIHITYTMRAETHNGHINCAFHLTCHARVTFKCCLIRHTHTPAKPLEIFPIPLSPSAGHDSFCMSNSLSKTAPMANMLLPKGRKPRPVVCRFLGVFRYYLVLGVKGGVLLVVSMWHVAPPTMHHPPPTANFVCVCVIVKFCARTICNGWHPYGRQVTFWFTVCYFLYPLLGPRNGVYGLKGESGYCEHWVILKLKESYNNIRSTFLKLV